MEHSKTAFLSPNINAGQVLPSADDQQKIFENKFGEMAYQAFAAKHPDILNDVVTFKLLDSDFEHGTAVGAFIVEQNGEYLYIPATISDNALKPFDIVYVKSKDMFVPLTPEWLEEIQKGTLASLGEGRDLPDTVATDVDIRNVIVPPTTGRYSYASAEPSPRSRMLAEASEPLGRKVANMAAGMPMGGQMGGAPMEPSMDPAQTMPGASAGGGGGGQGQSQFNPEIWATFVEQFNRIYNMSPGQALDEGMLDIEAMAKMYKSHTKTWEIAPGMGNMPPAQAGTPPMPMGAPPQEQGAMPQQGGAPMGNPMPKMANVATEVGPAAYKTIGTKLDEGLASIGRGALYGAGTGALYAGADRELGDVPLATLRGAIGGGIGAPIGRWMGHSVARSHPETLPNIPAVGSAGHALGGATGGYIMARSMPGTISEWTTPSAAAMREYYQDNPAAAMQYRTASVNDDGRAMISHALEKTAYANKLTDFLAHAPNNVKTAYARFLQDNPKILQKAASIYGTDNLLAALRHSKTAGVVNGTGGALYVADESSTSEDLAESFGSNTPEAFNGVLLRGYHFKDTRPNLNLAVQTQNYHDFHQAKEPGIYRIYNLEGSPRPALVVSEPIDLLAEDRTFFPRDINKAKPPEAARPSNEENVEPHSWLSPETKLMAVFGNGDYMSCDCIMGEQVTEVTMKGSPIYNRVFTDKKAAPSAGKGFFVFKRGAHYLATRPVTLAKVTTGSDKVVSGDLQSMGGWSSKRFVIDPRSPINRPRRLEKQNLVIIPANWKWVPLKKELNPADFLRTAEALSTVALDALQSMGASKAVVHDAGQSQFAVRGSKGTKKADAIRKLASDYNIHASAAEAMVKIAEIEGSCTSWIVKPTQYHAINQRVKTAQGMTQPQTPQGGAPAMQQPQQGMQQMPMQPPPMSPGMQPGMVNPQGPGMPPAMQEAPPPPEEPPASAVDVAFAESVDELQQQMDMLQSQLSVLQSVHERAQQLEAENMQGQPEGMDPTMAEDPAAQDPTVPRVPMMSTEEPSVEEIQSQLNPDFLDAAGQLQETGAFDAGSIGALAQDPSLQGLGSEYASNLEASLDDLGRTLLTAYMKESELKEQLGDESYAELETQLRTTFKGLGKLLISLTHSSAMLTDNEQIGS